MDTEIHYRINDIKGSLFAGFIFVVELVKLGLNFIPFLGNILAWLLGLVIIIFNYIFFKLHGVSLYDRSNLIFTLVSKFIQAIPVVDAIPSETLNTITALAVTKVEDTLAGISPKTLGAISGGLGKIAGMKQEDTNKGQETLRAMQREAYQSRGKSTDEFNDQKPETKKEEEISVEDSELAPSQAPAPAKVGQDVTARR